MRSDGAVMITVIIITGVNSEAGAGGEGGGGLGKCGSLIGSGMGAAGRRWPDVPTRTRARRTFPSSLYTRHVRASRYT